MRSVTLFSVGLGVPDRNQLIEIWAFLLPDFYTFMLSKWRFI